MLISPPRPGDRTRTAGLVGRDRELTTLRDLISSARAGHGGALVVHGGAGIGKTALLAAALETASGVRVLRATGSQYEMELPFAGLHQLLLPRLDRLDRLAAVQARALAAALGLADTGADAAAPTGPLVARAALALLADSAHDEPIVCAVDDAQWLDHASAQVLAYVAHRLSGTPVALVAAVREPAAAPGLAGLPELPLAGLGDPDDRTVLLAGLRTPLDPGVLDRILAEARGNPLALLELPHRADPAALAGGFGIPSGAGLPRALEDGFRSRLADLSGAARRYLTVAAADPTGDPGLVHRAARELGLDPAAPHEAIGTGLIEIDARLRFGHPLMRAAVYEAAPAADRVAAHRALAAATDPVTDPDRRAWHAAQATSEPDVALAGELERLSARAHTRGGLAAAAAFLERAAVLTADPPVRARRLLAAAAVRRETGELSAALDLVALAESAGPDRARRADAAVLRARVAFDRARDEDAVRRLIGAARQAGPIDPALGREVLFDALAAITFMGRFARRELLVELAAEAAALPAAGRGASPAELLLDGLLSRTEQGGPPDPALLGPALAAYLRHGRKDSRRFGIGEVWLACSAAEDVWDDRAFLELARRQLDIVRETGALVTLPAALSYGALALMYEGRFAEAQRLVDDAYAAAADLGTPGIIHVDVVAAAWRGDEQRVHRLGRAAVREATASGEGRLLTAVEYGKAVLLNGLGRYREAADACRVSAEIDGPSIPPGIFSEYVEATGRAGQLDAATRVVVRLERRAAELNSDWCTGTARCARALVTPGPAAGGHYRVAIEHLSRTVGSVRLARAHLLYGEWLRRNGSRTEATAQLRAARDAFVAMDAAAFAARATRELAAAGGTGRRGGIGGPGLTEQERVVARLVATGATTREVAAELFLSPRTVDSHLRAIFGKFGITSRRQLRGSLGDPDRTVETAGRE